jgi:crotonobetainyl-CoA:carnitine CoA-transferase CaiB-like acyl-CoA transferase
VRIGFDGLNPDLGCCHITGFGDSGPYRARPSFDFYRLGDERLHGEVEMLYFPIKFAEALCHIRRVAPDLGADTDVILGELGYVPEEMARLRRDGVM